jgi:hypothetical protein
MPCACLITEIITAAKPPHNDTRYSDIRGFNDTIISPAARAILVVI